MAAKLTLRSGITAFYGSMVALLLVGCDAGTLIVVDSCSGIVAVVVTPDRTVVRVGDTVTLDANFASPECVAGRPNNRAVAVVEQQYLDRTDRLLERSGGGRRSR